MRRGGILDIDGIDQVFSVADLPQLSLSGAVEQPRNQMLIARPPNQMRPQGASQQMVLAIGLSTICSARALRVRIVGEPALG